MEKLAPYVVHITLIRLFAFNAEITDTLFLYVLLSPIILLIFVGILSLMYTEMSKFYNQFFKLIFNLKYFNFTEKFNNNTFTLINLKLITLN